MGRYTNSQLRYAIVYVVVTFIALLILNVFCSNISLELFNRNKESSMVEKCQLAADEISKLEVINSSTVAEALSRMESLKVTRLIVTDHTGLIIHDSYQAGVRYALFPEILQAMEGNDVFSCHYHDGAMQSKAAIPIVSYKTTLGCVYMMEYDTEQGSLIQSLQTNVLRITVILEIVVILFSFAFALALNSAQFSP